MEVITDQESTITNNDDDDYTYVEYLDLSNSISDAPKRIKEKLETILHAPQFCGLCFDLMQELSEIDDVEICLSGKASSRPLTEIVKELFQNVANIPASPYVCKKCTDQTIQSYNFILDTKESVNTINTYVHDCYYKIVQVQDQLHNEENSTILIVLQGEEETSSKTNTTECRSETKDNHMQQITEIIIELKSKAVEKNVNAEKRQVIEKPIEDKETTTITEDKDKVTSELPIIAQVIRRKDGYECVVCKVLMTTFKEWKEHEKDFHKEAILKCIVCSKTFDRTGNLTAHYKMHGKMKCEICLNLIDDTSLAEHLKSYHKNETHACEQCDAVYYNALALLAHAKIKHFNAQNEKDSPQCLMCLKYFPEEKLKDHQCKDKCIDCSETPCIHYKYLLSYKEQTLNHASKIKCPDCDYFCYRREALVAHANREHLEHRPYSCECCGTQFYGRTLLKRHILTYHQGHLDCRYCDQRLPNEKLFNKHVQSCKNEDRPNKCTDCPASFNTDEELSNHRKLKHSTDNFPCEMCNKKFLTQDTLRMHKKIIHDIVQSTKKLHTKVKCRLCSEEFNTKGEYLLHKKTHGSEIRCGICNIEFDNMQKLHWHSRKHTNKKECPHCGNEYTYLRQHKCTKINEELNCGTCGMVMSSPKELKVHYKTHPTHEITLNSDKGKLICDVCHKNFKFKHSMASHLLTHSGDRKFICKLCGKGYFSSNALNHHRMNHTEKTVPCPICGKLFHLSRLMKKHVNKVHKKKAFSTNDFKNNEHNELFEDDSTIISIVENFDG